MGRVGLVLVIVSACSAGADSGDGSGSPDDPVIGFASTSSDADETDQSVSIPLELSDVTDHTVVALVSVTGGTATEGVDFSATTGVFVFPEGLPVWNVYINVAADDEPEPAETVELTVSSIEGARAGVTKHTFTIRSNLLPRVTFDAADSYESEGDTALLQVELKPASTQTITVDYLVSGTATEADYAIRTGTIMFPPGSTSQQLDLGIVPDALDEDPETLILSLANPTNAMLGEFGTLTHHIGDDDFEPRLSFAVDRQAVPEGDTGSTTATIDLKLDKPSGRTVTVGIGIGTPPPTTATAGSDFVLQTPSLTFPPGTTSQTVTVTVMGDTVQEGSESLTLQLTAIVNATTEYPDWHALTLENDECYGNAPFRFCPDTLPTATLTIPSLVNTSFSNPCAMTQPAGWTESGQPEVCVVSGTNVMISSAATYGTRPLIVFALDTITVTGLLDVTNGTGSQPSSCVAFGGLPGVGAGGAGGSFMTPGGDGGAHSSPAGAGGIAAPGLTASPTILRGGCRGQQGYDTTQVFEPAGAGGGAVYLVAGNKITLQPGAAIDASGLGGVASGGMRGGTGGGSGGMIVLWAPAITATSAFVVANGGGGSEGGSSNGTGTDGEVCNPLTPLVAASGGSGTTGGDGGDGFAAGAAAGPGSSTNNNNGAGAGGGGAGYIRTNQPLTGATVSPPP